MFFVLAITAGDDRTIRLSITDLLTIATYIIKHSRLRTLITYVPLMLTVPIDISENFGVEIFDAPMPFLLTIAICISPSKLDN